jgi:hypothetical protein
VECAAACAKDAGVDPASVATVFGSWHGEMEIAVEQLGVIHRGDGLMSPARFRNSVHNTGSGVFTIAAKNRGFTTAIAAGSRTFAMCVLEAMGLLAAGEKVVIVAVADEALPAPLDGASPHVSLGVAIALSREPPAKGRRMLQLGNVRRLRHGSAAASVAMALNVAMAVALSYPGGATEAEAATAGASAAGPALGLVEAMNGSGEATLALELADEGSLWVADLTESNS